MKFGDDSPPEVLAMIRAFLLDPARVDRDWTDLYTEIAEAATRFDEFMSDLTEEQASVSALDYMCAKDILAHLIIVNFAIAAVLEAIRTDTPLPGPPLSELFPGAQGRSLSELCQQHTQSAQILIQTAKDPIESDATAPHPLFGPLNAKEWMVVPPAHYGYHVQQIKEIQGTEAYAKA